VSVKRGTQLATEMITGVETGIGVIGVSVGTEEIEATEVTEATEIEAGETVVEEIEVVGIVTVVEGEKDMVVMMTDGVIETHMKTDVGVVVMVVAVIEVIEVIEVINSNDREVLRRHLRRRNLRLILPMSSQFSNENAV
jgi:hypothetical protein